MGKWKEGNAFMTEQLPRETALLIIDVQNAIDEPVWSRYGERNHPRAELRMAEILQKWRASGRPVFHIKHESRQVNSSYRPGQAGCDFKECVTPQVGETIVIKHVNNAFIGTDLESRLKEKGIAVLVIFGVITNNSVEAMVRMAGNLGFKTYLVEDACFTFAQPDYAGRLRTAAEVHAMSLANLDGEYCAVVGTAELLRML